MRTMATFWIFDCGLPRQRHRGVSRSQCCAPLWIGDQETGRTIKRHWARRRGRLGERLQAGRLFNSETGGHGRDARATTRQDGSRAASPTRRREHGDRAPWLQGREGPQKPAFCETNPFVMLGKVGLSGCCERRWTHYRKMTNGFVFPEKWGLVGRQSGRVNYNLEVRSLI